MYTVLFTKNAQKGLKNLKAIGLLDKALEFVEILKVNPYEPPYEKLIGNLSGKYSRRLNIQHRFVYEVYEDIKTVKVLSVWTHYETL